MNGKGRSAMGELPHSLCLRLFTVSFSGRGTSVMGELPHSLCLCLFTVSFSRREPLVMGVTTLPLFVSLHCQFQ